MVRECGVGVGVEEGVAVFVDVGDGVWEGVDVSVAVAGCVGPDSGVRISEMLLQAVIRRRKIVRVIQRCSILPIFMMVTSPTRYSGYVELDFQNLG
jgi:hypothetical protein